MHRPDVRHELSVLITNIGKLVLMPAGPVYGAAMSRIQVLERAALLTEGERIAWTGGMDEIPAVPEGDTIDAQGGCVIPGLIDCHTHCVFAGSREDEWVRKIEGRTYLEILQSGGGIHSTVAAVRAADEQALASHALPILMRMLALGVTTIEIKSGYGLSPRDELKMLRAIRRLSSQTCQDLIGTYLAAHTIPMEFQGRPREYLAAVTMPEVLREIRESHLAEFCDVFCERGAFDVAESEFYLQACAAAGLRIKVHADQLSQIGASGMAGRLGAISADHLEHVDDAGISAMQAGRTVPVLLPGCSLFLNTKPPDARRLINAGLPVALATDFNPGSCRIESLLLIMSLGCAMLRMTPMETLTACTANAAAALGRADSHGAICRGHLADLVILDVPSVERMCYEVGRNCARVVIKRGLRVHVAADYQALHGASP